MRTRQRIQNFLGSLTNEASGGARRRQQPGALWWKAWQASKTRGGGKSFREIAALAQARRQAARGRWHATIRAGGETIAAQASFSWRSRAKKSRGEWFLGSPTITTRIPSSAAKSRSGTVSAV